MFTINNELFIDLEPFLDLSKIYRSYEQIAYGIAKNYDRLYPTLTNQSRRDGRNIFSGSRINESQRRN